MKTALLIDDEPSITNICRDYLHNAGFTVLIAETGPHGIELARRAQPDVIVLDLMLPGQSGLEVCTELRRDSQVPIIMLTARVEEADKLLGLELGADDYITKPFSPRELVARVRSVLRRAAEPRTAEVMRVGDLTLDRTRYRAILPDREVTLTPTEFDILAELASQPGRIFSRGQLLTAARGAVFAGYERLIDSHVSNLRRKIEADTSHPTHILTVYGVGYRFAESA